ncbi:MAG: SCO family protein [Castellaniella sp.]|uniref:SCO family protein n=1 Tax=Castellaniella sp. TaxID=1955812 RepID=UPI00120165A9|nr:SCO family protein [Castellaniella sp.]TAN28949.1 MAG: SCO family protein [Castellaniella sp.]
MRLVLALVFALMAGLGSLYAVTSGFTVLTAEGARRQSVAAHPRVLPDAMVLDSTSNTFPLDVDLRRDGRLAIVNFFYTRCVALCLAQGALTGQLQQAIAAEGLQHRIRLISISFDPRDKAPDLARYAQRMGADPGVWQFLSFADPAQGKAALDVFGIMVVPAPLGEFEHNSAFHIVTPDGRLARVLDLDQPGKALEAAKKMLAVGAPTAAVPAAAPRSPAAGGPGS